MSFALLVGTITQLSTLQSFARTSALTLPCGWIEIRFDQLNKSEWPEAIVCAQKIQSRGAKFIGTIRLQKEGGKWVEDNLERIEHYHKLLECLDAVDIELESVFAQELIAYAHHVQKKIILSSHHFSNTPSLEVLSSLIARAHLLGSDIIKIATMARTLSDCDIISALLSKHRHHSIAIIGMGPYGPALRSFLPVVGSALTYGYIDNPSAPGQLSVNELAQILERITPNFQNE